MGEAQSDAPLVDPDHYAQLVASASDRDLQDGLDQNGELIIEQIFRAMPARLRRAAIADVELVAEWRIRDAGAPDELHWQVTIADGRCSVQRDGESTPDVSFKLKGIDFIKLITGNAHGPRLFLTGRLRIRGDLLKAARLQSYFRAPEARPGR